MVRFLRYSRTSPVSSLKRLGGADSWRLSTDPKRLMCGSTPLPPAMKIEYDKPIAVSSIQYDAVMKNLPGVCAGHFNSEKNTYEIKLWLMSYAGAVEKILKRHGSN